MTEKEEIKTKTEFLEIPDKVTQVTMKKIKNDAVGNFDIDPACDNLRLETEKTENIGPLETEEAFNNEQELQIDFEFEEAFQDDANENKGERLQIEIQIEEIDKAEQSRDKDNSKPDQNKEEGKDVSV